MYDTGGFFRLAVKSIMHSPGVGTGNCVVYKKWGKITSRLPEGTSVAHSLEMSFIIHKALWLVCVPHNLTLQNTGIFLAYSLRLFV
jgi:hypothetical protein